MSGYCGRGICAAMDGHEGTCAEASGWDADLADETSYESWVALRRFLVGLPRRPDPQRDFDMAEPS